MWNMCESIEGCVASASPPGDALTGLNRLGWSADGSTIAAGDVGGRLHLFGARYDVSDDAWDELGAVLGGEDGHWED
jgi:hypothetical protein